MAFEPSSRVLITSSASGLRLALVRKFAERGRPVAYAARRFARPIYYRMMAKDSRQMAATD